MQNMKIIALAVIALCSGCAQTTQYQKAKDQAQAYVERFNNERESMSTVTESDRPYVKAEVIEYRAPQKGGVSLNVNAVPLRVALQSALERAGYDLSFTGKVDANRPVTLSFSNRDVEKATKDLAFAAGYIAVFDRDGRRVTITDEATYTFKIDEASIEAREDKYSTTSNPGSGGGSTSGGGSGSGSNSGSEAGVATSTNIKLGAPNTGGSEDFLTVIRNMVGGTEKGPTVSYVKQTGMLVVRGNSAELRRVTDFLNLHQRDAATKVTLDAAIVEVTLNDDFKFGIDWGRVVPLSGAISGKAALNFSSRGMVTSPAITANITTNSLTAVIKALQERTVVNVVAQPSVTTLNHREGYYLRATQKPYVPQIDQSTVQNAGTTTTGKLAYVPDGISFAFKPSVLGPSQVRARILPVITAVGEQRVFPLGQSQLTGYEVALSQSHLEVELEAGTTTIVTGLNLDRANNLDAGVPGLSDVPLLGNLVTSKSRNGQKTQTIMLLRAQIIQPKNFQGTLVGESL